MCIQMRVKSSLRLFFVRLKSENKEKLKGKSKKEDFKEKNERWWRPIEEKTINNTHILVKRTDIKKQTGGRFSLVSSFGLKSDATDDYGVDVFVAAARYNDDKGIH